MAATSHAETPTPSPSVTDSKDPRNLIPILGLKEYWYPAIRDRDVGWKRPVFVRLLGEDICLFRGKSGEVAALANACPHRGAMLSDGDIAFKGFVTCFYHAYTFDEHGDCVAVLTEGPASAMPGKIRVRAYPTVTLKGVVFIWMGQGDPASLEESIPEEFHDPEAQVFNWVTAWPCNWRPALENVADSHFRYVHRNSALCLMRPISPPAIPNKGRPTIIGTHRLQPANPMGEDRGPVRGPYQDYYPGIDAKWPKHQWRLLWTWMFDWSFKRKWRRPYKVSEEWGPGTHLPGMVRLNYGSHLYTRWAVPVEENSTRLFYFHATKPSNALGRIYERIHWTLFHNWAMNKNFSEQDRRGAIESYYDTGENLSVTDMQTIMWRRLVLTARGLNLPREAEEARQNGAEGASPGGEASQEQKPAGTPPRGIHEVPSPR